MRVGDMAQRPIGLTDIQANAERLLLVAVHRQSCVDSNGVLQERESFLRATFRQQAFTVVFAHESGGPCCIDVSVFAVLLARCGREQRLQLSEGCLSLSPAMKQSGVYRDRVDVVAVGRAESLE